MNEWTGDQKDVLREMWAEGRHAKDIGTSIGRTKNSVLGMADRLGLPKHAWTMRKRKPRDAKRKAKIKEIKPPQDVEEITFTSSGVSFLEVGSYECHAIIGRDNDRYSLVRFCGVPVEEGESYCLYHCRQFFNPRVR